MPHSLKPDSAAPDHLEGRVSRVESQLSSLTADVENLVGLVSQQSANIGRLQEGMAESLRRQGSELTAAIQGVANKVEVAQRPQWATYASWAAVLLAFGGIFGSIVMGAIGEDREALHELEARDLVNEREHGVMQERTRWIEKQLDKEARGG